MAAFTNLHNMVLAALSMSYIPEEYPEGVGDQQREADVEGEALGAPLAPDGHELRDVRHHSAHHHRHLQVDKPVKIYVVLHTMNTIISSFLFSSIYQSYRAGLATGFVKCVVMQGE